ncbi:unnamed protein product [Staurois parvus]|uniref:Uncharacterized protein n=1 Tax=Staurois parvus TaxID=386267 RepID=A0ABN9ARZ7_9NEOB|nr:unnamed protein product [Staurois parvus]
MWARTQGPHDPQLPGGPMSCQPAPGPGSVGGPMRCPWYLFHRLFLSLGGGGEISPRCPRAQYLSHRLF